MSDHGSISSSGIDHEITTTITVSSCRSTTFLSSPVTTPVCGLISLTLTLTCVKFLLINGCLSQPCIWMVGVFHNLVFRWPCGTVVEGIQTAPPSLTLGGIQFCYSLRSILLVAQFRQTHSVVEYRTAFESAIDHLIAFDPTLNTKVFCVPVCSQHQGLYQGCSLISDIYECNACRGACSDSGRIAGLTQPSCTHLAKQMQQVAP